MDCFHLRGALGIVAICCSPACGARNEEPPSESGDFTVLSYNIGNNVEEPEQYKRRIRSRDFEAHLRQKIDGVDAHVIFLQEVLSPAECARGTETNPELSCYGPQEENPPARRILGPSYSIACDANQQSKCIAVHEGFGTIRGVEPGGLLLQGAETAPMPGPTCGTRAECEANENACLDQTSISGVIIDSPRFGSFQVVNVHTSAFGEPCRLTQLNQAFEMVDAKRAIIAGDFNFDPSRTSDQSELDIWRAHVGKDERYESHNPTVEETDLVDLEVDEKVYVPTHEDRALDFVLSDFTDGTCDVVDDPPLDSGIDFEGRDDMRARRPDHFAVLCHLSVESN